MTLNKFNDIGTGQRPLGQLVTLWFELVIKYASLNTAINKITTVTTISL